MALVQTTGKRQADGVSGSTSTNASASFTSGNWVLVGIAHYVGNSARISGVTIGGVAATRDVQQIGTAPGLSAAEVWRAQAVGGSSAIVITYGGGSDNYVTFSAEEHTTLTASPFDQSGTKTSGTGTAPAVTSGSITQADELLFAVAENDDGTSSAGWSAPSGWTQAWVEQDSNSHQGGQCSYRYVTGASGAQTATWGHTSGVASVAVIATYKVSAAGPSGSGTARAGARGDARGTKASTQAGTGRGGARASGTGSKAATAAATGRAGGRASAVGAKGQTPLAEARGGARGTAVGVRVATGGAETRAGVRATAEGFKAATGSAVARAGGRAEAIGATGTSRTAQATGGGRVEASGFKAATGSATASAGARSQAGSVKAVQLGAAARGGGRVETASAKAAAGGAEARAGGTVDAFGSTTPPVFGSGSARGGARAEAFGIATHGTGTGQGGGGGGLAYLDAQHQALRAAERKRREAELEAEQARAVSAREAAEDDAAALEEARRSSAPPQPKLRGTPLGDLLGFQTAGGQTFENEPAHRVGAGFVLAGPTPEELAAQLANELALDDEECLLLIAAAL